ncbi:hypothetical protein [Bradyrhizobium ganzhouense]|uniref:hypothetical protein n=1 Tax=Bradyrhizobium ganzhouense TaxID=1179767 RepID=UPI003CEE5596
MEMAGVPIAFSLTTGSWLLATISPPSPIPVGRMDEGTNTHPCTYGPALHDIRIKLIGSTKGQITKNADSMRINTSTLCPQLNPR